MNARVSRFMVRDQLSDLQLLAARLIDTELAKKIYVANSYHIDEGVRYQWVHTRTTEGYTTGLEEVRS